MYVVIYLCWFHKYIYIYLFIQSRVFIFIPFYTIYTNLFHPKEQPSQFFQPFGVFISLLIHFYRK